MYIYISYIYIYIERERDLHNYTYIYIYIYIYIRRGTQEPDLDPPELEFSLPARRPRAEGAPSAAWNMREISLEFKEISLELIN